MRLPNFSTHSTTQKSRRCAALLPLLLVLASAAGAAAQAAPSAGATTEGAPAPLLEMKPDAAAQTAQVPALTAEPDVRALTAQLLELEAKTVQLEQARAAIRVKGMRIGKIVSWSVTALMLVSAFSSYAQAEGIKDALKDGRDDKAYDADGDKDVDKDDEQRARRTSRALAITSLIPIGLGVWTSLVYRRRTTQQRDLTYQLEDVSLRRRSLLQRMAADLGVSQQHASLQLRLAF
jgi:hypothetical protein